MLLKECAVQIYEITNEFKISLYYHHILYQAFHWHGISAKINRNVLFVIIFRT